jgi:hypothetical protein
MIIDRGPFTRGFILDLADGEARAIGGDENAIGLHQLNGSGRVGIPVDFFVQLIG